MATARSKRRRTRKTPKRPKYAGKAHTARTLYKSSQKVAKWRAQPTNAKRLNLRRAIPVPLTGTALFHFEAHGLTQKALHQMYLQFTGLEVTQEARESATHFKVEHKGTVFYVEKPDVNTTRLLVRCSCKDFYFVFSLWNFNEKALFGRRPKKYVRKTTWMPPRNPGHHPGLCKHLQHAINMMQNHRLTKVGR